MKLGIMQPYFMPYIGYWQLMNAVDKYIIYDDVNFIKGGWIHRNRILINGQIKYFNIPMLGASSQKLINEIAVNQNENLKNKNLRILMNAYQKAPYFNDIFPILEEILNCKETILSKFILNSFQYINEYLNIQTELILSSSLKKDCNLRGEKKVLAICELMNATEYYNAIGGRELYSFEAFERKGIKLNFLKSTTIKYSQFSDHFQENLSIIDILMFNSKEQIKEMLRSYTLIKE